MWQIFFPTFHLKVLKMCNEYVYVRSRCGYRGKYGIVVITLSCEFCKKFSTRWSWQWYRQNRKRKPKQSGVRWKFFLESWFRQLIMYYLEDCVCHSKCNNIGRIVDEKHADKSSSVISTHSHTHTVQTQLVYSIYFQHGIRATQRIHTTKCKSPKSFVGIDTIYFMSNLQLRLSYHTLTIATSKWANCD